MVHVASSQRSRGREAKDGRFDGVECDVVEVGPNYPSVVVVFILAHRGILVFCFSHINRTIGLLWECASLDPSPTPFTLGFHFCRVWVCFMS
jgi:hypothetical protein